MLSDILTIVVVVTPNSHCKKYKNPLLILNNKTV